jgi:O-antigen/teichoic acid export membrane protein
LSSIGPLLPNGTLRLVRAAGRKPFVRGVLVLAGGTAAAQLLTAAAYPILVRLFDPEEFGLFALFSAISITFAGVASWRYEYAIVLARTQEEAVNLLALAMLLVFLTAIVGASGVIAFLGPELLRLLDAEAIMDYLWLLPLTASTWISSYVLTFWGTREGTFALISLSQIWRSLGTVVVQVGAGLLQLGVFGLILGMALGSVSAALVLLHQFKGRWRSMALTVEWREMARLARVHRDFPLYNTPTSVLNSTAVTIPVFLLAPLFGPAVAGLYWFTDRLLEMPMSMVGNAVRRVFYADAADRFREDGALFVPLLRTMAFLAALALPAAAVTILAGPQLFAIVFGHAWREAGVFAQWLVLWWTFRFIAVPVHMLVPLLGLQRTFFLLELGTLPPRVAALLLAAAHADALAAVAAYSFVGIISSLACIAVVILRVRRHDAALSAGTALAVRP